MINISFTGKETSLVYFVTLYYTYFTNLEHLTLTPRNLQDMF